MTLNPTDFPPYGNFNVEERNGALDRVPDAWISPKPDPALTRMEQWIAWRDGVVANINNVLWPSWDYENARWHASPAFYTMPQLTAADFRVMAAMEERYPGRGLELLPDSPNQHGECRTHRLLFIIEDDRKLDGDKEVIPLASYYSHYDSTMPESRHSRVRSLFFTGIRRKLASASHQIKYKLQRPRPYQMALRMGFPDFWYEFGKTAPTPSACSGHCLQGLIAVGAVYEAFLDYNFGLDDLARNCMRQFAVDLGDRRVMAGVHYPSDNLCSWLILMEIAHLVFPNRAVKKFLWDAITTRSLVYREILRWDAAGHSEFRPALDAIQAAAGK